MKMFELNHIMSFLIIFHTTYSVLTSSHYFFPCFGLGLDCFVVTAFYIACNTLLFMEIHFLTAYYHIKVMLIIDKHVFPYTARKPF